MSFWDRVTQAVLAAGLGRQSSGGRFPTDTSLIGSEAQAANRLPMDRPRVPRDRVRRAANEQQSLHPRQPPSASQQTPDQSPRLVRPVATHVEMFFAFILDNFAAGEMLDADEMVMFYEVFCDRTGLVQRKWNPIAKELKFLMAPGPQGSGKPYHNMLLPDGTYKEKRVWFVPARKSPKRQSTPRGRHDVEHQRQAA